MCFTRLTLIENRSVLVSSARKSRLQLSVCADAALPVS